MKKIIITILIAIALTGTGWGLYLAGKNKGDNYYTVTGNTTLREWPEYQPLFYNSINSFKFKN